MLGFEEIVSRNRTWRGDEPSEKLGARTEEQLMREIRWANLGWVYQVSPPSARPQSDAMPSGRQSRVISRQKYQFSSLKVWRTCAQ